MKRILCAFLVIAICLMTPLNAFAVSDQYKLKISFSAKRTSNNHVGNSWSVVATVGDTTIKKGKSATLKYGDADTFTIVCTATENDKTPDVGTATIDVNVGELKNGKNKFTQTVVVTENAGRYTGNTAEWVFTITVSKKAV